VPNAAKSGSPQIEGKQREQPPSPDSSDDGLSPAIAAMPAPSAPGGVPSVPVAPPAPLSLPPAAPAYVPVKRKRISTLADLEAKGRAAASEAEGRPQKRHKQLAPAAAPAAAPPAAAPAAAPPAAAAPAAAAAPERRRDNVAVPDADEKFPDEDDETYDYGDLETDVLDEKSYNDWTDYTNRMRAKARQIKALNNLSDTLAFNWTNSAGVCMSATISDPAVLSIHHHDVKAASLEADGKWKVPSTPMKTLTKAEYAQKQIALNDKKVEEGRKSLLGIMRSATIAIREAACNAFTWRKRFAIYEKQIEKERLQALQDAADNADNEQYIVQPAPLANAANL